MKKIVFAFVLIAMAGVLASIAHRVSTSTEHTVSRSQRVEAALLFSNTISPIISQTTQKNREAAQRAVQEIESNFRQYQQGVKPFVEDLTSWGTRLKIIGKLGSDFWANWNSNAEKQTLVTDFVAAQFSNNVVSEERLESDLKRVLDQFAADVEANRNVMLASVQTEIALARLPVSVTTVAMKSSLAAEAKVRTANMPRDSVVVGLTAFAAGWVAEKGVTMLVRAIVAQTAARMVTMTAAAGAAGAGATGTGAVAGGGAGTVLEPGGGTVVGIVVGMAVGLVVDLWMSSKLEKKLTDDCIDFLQESKRSLLYGDKGDAGLKKSLDDTVTVLDSSFRFVIHDALEKATQ